MTADIARVFFALWPGDQVKMQLHQVAKRLHTERGGRLTRAETIHLTLLFLGAVPRAQLPTLISAANTIEAKAFDTAFDYTSCWRHNQIAFLGTRQPPSNLLALVDRLEAIAAKLGLAFDRRAYKPHITLVRHARCAKLAEESDAALDSPIKWSASEFVLVESKPGPGGITYPVLARFPMSIPPSMES